MTTLLYQQIEDVIEAWLEAHPNPQGYVELVRAVHDFTSKAIDKARADAARMAARFADDKYAAMMDELNDRDEAAIAAAVREERERCAGVARGWAGFKPEDASRPKSVMMAKLANLIANQIAAAIEGEDDEAE